MIVGADACSTCLVALKTGVASTVLACGPSISWIQAPEFCTLRYVVVDVVLHGARPAVPLCLSLALIVLALLGRLPVVQGSCIPSCQERRLNVDRGGRLRSSRRIGFLALLVGEIGGTLIVVGGWGWLGSRGDVSSLLLVARAWLVRLLWLLVRGQLGTDGGGIDHQLVPHEHLLENAHD